MGLAVCEERRAVLHTTATLRRIDGGKQQRVWSKPWVGVAGGSRKLPEGSGLDLDDDRGELFTYLSPGFASGVMQACFAETLQATSLY